MKHLRRAAFQRESLPPVQLTLQPSPPALIPLSSEPGIPSDPVSLLLVESQGAGASSTFQTSHLEFKS